MVFPFRKGTFQDKRKIKEEHIAYFHHYYQDHHERASSIDDFTWSDLHGNDLLKKLDKTKTSPGEYVLYTLLRNPLLSEGALHKRQEEIQLIATSPLREAFNKAKTSDVDLMSLFDDENTLSPTLKLAFHIGSVLPFVTIIYFIFNMSLSSLNMMGAAFFINMILHYKFGEEILKKAKAMQYFGYLVGLAQELSKKMPAGLQEDYPLAQHATSLALLHKKSKALHRVDGMDVLGDYMNILFLIKERAYIKAIRTIKNQEDDLIHLFYLMGKLDVLSSLGDLQRAYPVIQPEFHNLDLAIEAKGLYHPLLERAVENDLSLTNRGMIITGSNMSGKSTFLRSLGINVLLAQSINLVFADSFKASPFLIRSSISLNDNLLEGNSYYLSEALAIKGILTASKDYPVLGLIDEIFKGTNPRERISAASELLNFMDKENILAVVTTHDLTLLPLIDNYDTYYFADQVTKEGLSFDYKMREGVSPTSNAIKILEYLDYPEPLISTIYRRLEEA